MSSLVVGIDPSAERPGYAVCRDDGTLVYASVDPPPLTEPAAWAVVEGPWIGRMGKLQMWGLGADAGWRLRGVSAMNHAILRPKDWRSEWGYGAGLPKDVIVARLRRDLERSGRYEAGWTDDVVEACGIAIAFARKLQRGAKLPKYALVSKGRP